MGLLKSIIKEVTRPVINNYKGRVGEREVNKKLNPLIFGKVEHRQINNLILMDENGKSHQIDHVEIRENGIFCIETKNYKGWIFGDSKSEYWTQSLYNGEKYQFRNPIKQNKSHIYQIDKVLEGKYYINSVIVMVQNNADKIYDPNVINLKDLKKYLKNFEIEENFTIEEMDEIYNKLKNAASHISNKEHVQNIKNTQKEIDRGICPRCGGRLIWREGKYGKFVGCENYPECKFILKNK